MFRFILEKEQKELKKEYLGRFLVSLFGAGICVLIAGMFLLLPSYWMLKTQSKVLLDQLSFYEKSEIASQTKELELATEKMSRSILWLEKDDVYTSDFLKKITDQAGNKIKINSISFSVKNEEQKILVEISGNSPNREEMIAFSHRLEEQGFDSVTVPYSNLTKESNVPFTISFYITTKHDK